MDDKATPGGSGSFWLGWDLSEQSKTMWSIWARENDIAIMDPSKLHFTQFYANAEAPGTPWPQPMQAAFTCRPNGVAWLGKALVVLFNAPQFVLARFEQLRSEYTHSFASLIPHMSLFYNENLEGIASEEQTAMSIRLNRLVNTMPDLTFVNEQINAPNDSAALFMETAGFLDVAKKDSTRAEFLSAFFKALYSHPELIEAWKSGDKEVYRKAWVGVLQKMDAK
jgi:hypothetical protein